MSRARRGARLALALLGLTLGPAVVPPGVGAVGEDPAAEVTEALRALGPPGVLWGRLVVEEESPVGPWTPIPSVEVTLYPATPTLVAELERIRQSARASADEFESAVARVQAALAAHQARIDARSPDIMGPDGSLPAEPPVVRGLRAAAPPPAPSGRVSLLGPLGRTRATPKAAASPLLEEPTPHPWRQKTDPAGLFAFESLPSGDWLVVVIQIAPYRGEKLRGTPKAKSSGRGIGYLPRAVGPAKEAEVWVTRVRLGPGERVGVPLTDRARWLAGPVR